MHKLLKHILTVVFYLMLATLHAQHKYAVLVAVNNYYDQPGVKSSQSLQGCVNDANAIKNVLLNCFGFRTSDIHNLYDSNVTKQNVIGQMHALLQKCKQGDVVVFYYAGHGVWAHNNTTEYDSVKKGKTQAIVMSNLYAPYWGCLLRDATLKKIFNEFVAKKVILTTVFDCCFSGSLAMYVYEKNRKPVKPVYMAERTIRLENIPYVPETVRPKGCVFDSSGALQDTLDTDKDGIPDCRDWEVHTPAFVSYTDTLGVGTMTAWDDSSEDSFFAVSEPYYDSLKKFDTRADTKNGRNSETTSRFYVLKDVGTITDNEKVPRPSEQPHSAFLFLSATNDSQPADETTDKAGVKHGVFTKTLLDIFKNNPPDMRVDALMQQITAKMLEQKYTQTPTYHFDPERKETDFIGLVHHDLRKTKSAQ